MRWRPERSFATQALPALELLPIANARGDRQTLAFTPDDQDDGLARLTSRYEVDELIFVANWNVIDF